MRREPQPDRSHDPRRLATLPQVWHEIGMTGTIRLDSSNRIVLSRDLRRAAGIGPGQTLKVSAVPGRVVIETTASGRGAIVKRGKLKVWSGAVPSTPLSQAVEQARRYER